MLVLKRENSFVDSFRDYKVFIDGILVGEIGKGETKAFELTEGHHLVHLEIDWCRSKKLSLDIEENKNITLHTSSSMKWFNFPFLYLMFLTVFNTRYIKINDERSLIEKIESKFSPNKEINLRKLQTIKF